MAICTGLGRDGNWIVTTHMMSRFDRKKSLAENYCYPTGVTARPYFREANDSLVHPVEFVELVPEPDNEVDPSAVKVVTQGKKIGFVPAHIALHLHPYISLMRNEGIRCFVPLTEPAEEIDTFDDFDDEEIEIFISQSGGEYDIGVMMLPTWETLDRLCPVEKFCSMFDEVWEELSEEARLEIKTNHWRFGETSFAQFRKIGTKKTSYPFTIDASQHPDKLLERYLIRYRRFIDKAQKERKQAVRNLHMVEKAAEGMTYREIGEMYGLKAGSVGSIVRQAKKNGDMQWRDTVESIPAEEDQLKKKVLEEKFGLNRDSMLQRSKWVAAQKSIDFIGLKVVETESDAGSRAKKSEPVKGAEVSAIKPQGLRGMLARFFG